VKLLYHGKRTRPDVLTAVSYLSTLVKYPIKETGANLNRVMDYLSVVMSDMLTMVENYDEYIRSLRYRGESWVRHLVALIDRQRDL
jgi:uncharacterized Fe-S radical SAM superfamily protein PflX